MKTSDINRSLNIFGLLVTLLLSLSSYARLTNEETARLEQQLGQMVLAGFKGTSPEDSGVQAVARHISAGKLGGVILFRHNIESPEQLKKLTTFLHQASATPLIVAVDQEGGRVQRLTADKGFTSYPSHQEMGSQNVKIDEAYLIYRKMALELKEFGINLNIAPVVDLSINPESKIIAKYGRSFSSDPLLTKAYARSFILAHRDVGVLTTIKHWPGHGSAAEDSHLGIVDITKTWSKNEQIPYESLMQEGNVDAVMTAHVFHRGLDAHKPATLSAAIIQGKLRSELGFDGVVLTDCLQMGAITSLFAGRTQDAALLAIEAGVDMMVVSNFHLDDSEFLDRLLERALERMRDDNGYLVSRLDESNRRILQLKKRLLVSGSHDEL